MQIIDDIITPCIDELNGHLDEPINAVADTTLWGVSSPLSSIDFVSLIVSIEDKVQDQYGVTITLASESALSRKQSPFRTVSALAAYVEELLHQAGV